MRRIRWQAIVRPGAVFHVDHARVGRGPESEPHGHDFAEVFWVAAGAGSHVLAEGRTPLRPGDLVLVAHEDRHGFQTPAGGFLDIVNVAFPRDVYVHLLERYGAAAELARLRRTVPRVPLRLEGAEVESLEGAALELQRAEPGLAAIERFLLVLLRIVSTARRPARGGPADAGVAAGRTAAAAGLRGAPAGGLAEFLRVAGRSPELWRAPAGRASAARRRTW